MLESVFSLIRNKFAYCVRLFSTRDQFVQPVLWWAVSTELMRVKCHVVCSLICHCCSHGPRPVGWDIRRCSIDVGAAAGYIGLGPSSFMEAGIVASTGGADGKLWSQWGWAHLTFWYSQTKTVPADASPSMPKPCPHVSAWERWPGRKWMAVPLMESSTY